MSHYALSEILIILAALWGMWVTLRRKNGLAALGFLCFAVIGAIAVYRFGFDRIETMAKVHKTASQLGGLAATYLFIAGVITAGRGLKAVIIGGAVVAALLVMAVIRPDLVLPAVVLIGVVLPLVILWQSKSIGWAAASALMLPNMILIRQSEHLGPDLSWHAFHTLIAIWLVILAFFFKFYHQRLNDCA